MTVVVPHGLRGVASSGRVKVAREQHCRMCMRPAHVRSLTRHHLIPQRWFYSDGLELLRWRNANANIVPLCRPCHDIVDGRDRRTRREARRQLRRAMTQTEIAFVIAIRGREWLDANYPDRLAVDERRPRRAH